MSDHEPRFVLIRGNARLEPIPPTRCKPDMDATNRRYAPHKRPAWLLAGGGVVIGIAIDLIVKAVLL